MHDLTALALSAGRGDRQALDAFVRAAQPSVWRYCRALVGPAQADDLTQETFLRALKALPRFEARSTAQTWLLSIARRACADWIRGQQRRARLLGRLGRPADDVVVDDTSTVELEQLLATLDPDRREAFVLTQVVGLSYAEAAEVCDCPVGTIRSRVARARFDLMITLDSESGNQRDASGD